MTLQDRPVAVDVAVWQIQIQMISHCCDICIDRYTYISIESKMKAFLASARFGILKSVLPLESLHWLSL